MVDSHNIKYSQISVGVRVGMQQQTDEKVKIEVIASTPNFLAALLWNLKFQHIIITKPLIEECL